MTGPKPSQPSPVHPHQLEVQEFSSYALIVDLRDAAAFNDDHVPGAVLRSGPATSALLTGEPSPVRVLVAEDATRSPAAYVGQPAPLEPGATVLVYDDEGGRAAEAWAAPLRGHGVEVDVLPGGWQNYRRWVEAGLEQLPRTLRWRCLRGPALSGTDLVLDALRVEGGQVLDVGSLRGRATLSCLGSAQAAAPSQNSFDSRLLNALRHLDAERDVWVAACDLGPGDPAVPPALLAAVEQSPGVHLEVPVAQRARWWCESLRGLDVAAVIDSLATLSPQPTRMLLDRCRQLAAAHGCRAALEAFLAGYVVQRSTPVTPQTGEPVLQLDVLDASAVRRAVRSLPTGQISP